MCRSIRRLRTIVPPPTTGDSEAAALQFVRKVSGLRTPPRAAVPAFEQAVAEVAEATNRLLVALGATPAPGPATPPALWPRPARRDSARRDAAQPRRGDPSTEA
jgi:hypothetical protein